MNICLHHNSGSYRDRNVFGMSCPKSLFHLAERNVLVLLTVLQEIPHKRTARAVLCFVIISVNDLLTS